MNQTTNQPIYKNAVVIGGSMAGLLTARILSKHFAHVMIIERDKVHDQPETRKGQPHTRHLHALLAKGMETMRAYFPGLVEELRAAGAITTDMGKGMRWHTFGGYRIQFESGMIGALMSRPLLEWVIRRRVLALPNVTMMDESEAEQLIMDDQEARVTGLCVTNRGTNDSALYHTDLIVDASGRGSAAPKWLEALGFAKPSETLVKVNVGYATRIYRRQAGDLQGAELIMVAPDMPKSKRTGLIFPIEGDRWICTLGGWAGDHPPTDEAGFLAFAHSLPAPDVYEMLTRLEPISEIVPHKMPGSLRRHYEKLSHFPEGFLLLGDAICSFNPVYGQGMTSAALQAVALDQLLTKRSSLRGLWRPFFKAAAGVVDMPWQLAVGEDFRFPETEGIKPTGVDFVNRYVANVHKTTHHDPIVYTAFLKVMNLMAPPATLFHPKILWRVLRSQTGHSRQQPSLAIAGAR